MTPRRRRRGLIERVRHRTPRYLAQFAALRLVHLLGARELEFPLLPDDLADSQSLPPFSPPAAPGRPLRIGWLTIPPGPGSGGHTTQFRMMQAAERAGMRNTLLLYDRHAGDLADRIDTIRTSWPWLSADIRPVPPEIRGFDALVATSWPTAHVLARRGREGQRAYFIQDYEPYFSPRGAEYALAEDTYRFGFRNIALGRMVRDCLRDEAGVGSDLVPFGCDTEVYALQEHGQRRRGVVLYARQGTDRRGFTLAMRALEVFHERLPSEPIHVYGDALSDAPFPVVSHGNLTPSELNDLYSTVTAGLALSFTNISLVAEEMLAAGVVPVVNDSALARADMPNPHVAWALPTPQALADALVAAVARPDLDAHAAEVAQSVIGRSWHESEQQVVRILADTITPSPHSTG